MQKTGVTGVFDHGSIHNQGELEEKKPLDDVKGD